MNVEHSRRRSERGTSIKVEGEQMKIAVIAMPLIAAALAGCQSTAGTPTGAPNSMLTNAGFTAKRASTPAQIALLNSLPANQFVRQTASGKATYLVADPT